MTELLERTSIDTIDDFVDGDGACVKSVTISNLSIGTSFSMHHDNISFVDAVLNIEIAYAAGYVIGGNFTFNSLQKAINISDHESLINYAKHGLFELDIQYSADDDMPYNNWWVRVDKDKAVLNDILIVGAESFTGEDFVGCLGENFGFEYDETCREVAYLFRAKLEKWTVEGQGNLIDKLARKAIVSHLEACVDKVSY